MPTIGDALMSAARELLDAGIASGSLEASMLLGKATGHDRLGLITRTGEELAGPQAEAFAGLLGRRLKREPLQYILGQEGFMGLDLEVNPKVLIPRPDTEVLVEAVLDLEEDLPAREGVSAADVGTGSGAIAIALAKSLPYLKVTALDTSAEALEVARRNGERHEVQSQVAWVLGDGLEALSHPVTYLVSNPPYIPEGELAGLEPEVRDHEPHSALTPGADGLHFYRRLCGPEGQAKVEAGGWLAVEVGQGQADAVVELLLAAEAWEEPNVIEDFGRIKRVVMARRKAP
jgi:release factor glutamine methyltransferase